MRHALEKAIRRTRTRLRPPHGRQLVATFDIPENFGGVTHALLHRTLAFSETTGRPVDILTFAHNDRLPQVRRELTHRGFLGPQIRLRNMWEELAQLSDAVLQFADFECDEAEPSILATGWERRTLDVNRPDGSLLAQQLWHGDYRKPSNYLGLGDLIESTTIFDHASRPRGAWNGGYGVQHFWLDHVTGREDAVLIADAAVAVDIVATYQRRAVATIFVLHTNHLRARRLPPYAPLSSLRTHALERIDGFDATVLLTERQEGDISKLLGPADNRFVIPNGLDTAGSVASQRGTAGAIISRLVGGKRIDHAIRAIGQVAQLRPEVRLDIFGTGPAEDHLRALRAEVGVEDLVAFRGYTNDPESAFAAASFSLLCSASEGMSLVLIESMANGCVPIAYDIPYGPAEIITHGEDGFLVRAGDTEALARQIREFLELDPQASNRMRDKAVSKARAFDHTALTPRWASVIDAAVRRRARRCSVEPLTPVELADDERRAALTRSFLPNPSIELTKVVWGNDQRFHLSGTVSLAPGDLTITNVLVEVVNLETGHRHRAVAVTLADNVPLSSRASFDAYLEGSAFRDEIPAGWIIWVTCETEMFTVSDSIRARRFAGPLATLPLAAMTSGERLVCQLDRDRGLLLRRPKPRVSIASADVRDRTVSVRVADASDEFLTEVVATSGQENTQLRSFPTILGEFNIELPADDGLREKTWELRGITVDGKSLLLAWQGDTTALAATASRLSPVQLETTSYGYLKITDRAVRAAVVALEVESTTIHATVEMSATEKRGIDLSLVSKGTESTACQSTTRDGATRATFDVSLLSVGAYSLRLRRRETPWSDESLWIPTTPEVQMALPQRLGSRVTITRTRGAGALWVVVS